MGTATRNRPHQASPHSPQDVCEAENAKYLKAQANTNQAEIVFVPGVQKLIRVHHYGLMNRVNRHGTVVKYAERPLLGISSELEKLIQETRLRWLEG